MILIRILSRDVLQFMTVFMFFVVSYGGGLYFALRGESCGLDQSTNESDFSVALNTSHCLHPDETRFFLYSAQYLLKANKLQNDFV